MFMLFDPLIHYLRECKSAQMDRFAGSIDHAPPRGGLSTSGKTRGPRHLARLEEAAVVCVHDCLHGFVHYVFHSDRAVGWSCHRSLELYTLYRDRVSHSSLLERAAKNLL